MQSLVSILKEKLYTDRRTKFITAKLKIIRQFNQQYRYNCITKNNDGNSFIIERQVEMQKLNHQTIKKSISSIQSGIQKTKIKKSKDKNPDEYDYNDESQSTIQTMVSRNKGYQVINNEIVDSIMRIVNGYIQTMIQNRSTCDNFNQLFGIHWNGMFEEVSVLFRQLAQTSVQFSTQQELIVSTNHKLIQYAGSISEMVYQICNNQQSFIIHQQQYQQLLYQNQQQNEASQNIHEENSIQCSKTTGFHISQIYINFITGYIEQYLLILYQHNRNIKINIQWLSTITSTLYRILAVYPSVFDSMIYCQLLTLYTIVPMLLTPITQIDSNDDKIKNIQSKYQHKIDVNIYQLLVQLLQFLQTNNEYNRDQQSQFSFNEHVDEKELFQAATRFPLLKQACVQYLLIVCILNHVYILLLEQYVNIGYFQRVINAASQIGDEYWALANIIIGRLRNQSRNKEMIIAVESVYLKIGKELKDKQKKNQQLNQNN